MSIGLDPVTLEEAGPIMARAMNMSWQDDRCEVIRHVNRYRLLLYTEYDKLQLFDNVYHCICPTRFDQACGAACTNDPTFRGFTLPSDVLSLETVWAYGQPLTLRSRWRESHVGLRLHSLPAVDVVPLDENFSTERDLTEPSRLKIFTEHASDQDRCAYIEVITAGGRHQKLTFKLIGDGFAISKMKVSKILSVVLPSDRRGALTLMQADGYVLSDYAPGESSVPVYRRYKLADTCGSATILIKGTKKYQNVYFGHDIVEVGNALIIEAAASYFKYSGSTTDPKELKRALFDRAELQSLLLGLQARHRGNAIQDDSPVQSFRPFRKTPLPGYR